MNKTLLLLSLLSVPCMALNAAPAAATTFSLAATTGSPTAVTMATVSNDLMTIQNTIAAQPVGQCYRVSTLAAAPTALRFLGGVNAASSITPPPMVDNVDGKIVLTPGTGVTIQTTTAAAIFASFTWEEVGQ